ncbi:MAG TPA: multidrug ABC transporter ATP-binding protein [Verrucomicrobia bacterium]|nr:MAG: multidrug ABC transporter ATP-binding protein [Lentisphaerae bacterium GWF2_57_35]HBA83373.1 multidrug ABC transporter ATP-binding protein [Verrucomicrobiota bacterium]
MTATSDIVIEVKELTKAFGHFKAVDRLSLSVRRGEIFGFLGPNGAGKSTTIRMLCGLLSSSSGTATVGGFDINRAPEQVRQSIGYMSQRFSLYRDLTVSENIAFFGGIYGLQGERLRERTKAIVEMAGLEGLGDRLTGTLSGALQQRLALGCAVLHEPPILFLDEPTSGVDPISRRMFWDLIQGLAVRGVTILITTHFMDEAEFCGRIGFISAGRLVALDTPSAIKTEAVQEDLFEVNLASFRGARETVVDLEGLMASSYFGPRLHLFCRKGRYTEETLRKALQDKALVPLSVSRASVSLEDAFIRLAG